MANWTTNGQDEFELAADRAIEADADAANASARQLRLVISE